MSLTGKLAAAFTLAAVTHVGLMAANIGDIDDKIYNELRQAEKARPVEGYFQRFGGNTPFVRYNVYTFRANREEGCLYKAEANIVFGKLFNKQITTECKPVTDWVLRVDFS